MVNIDLRSGLDSKEANTRFEEYGPNQLAKPEPIRFFAIALEEIQEPMILLLLATGVLYSILGNLGDAITIFAVIILLLLSEVFTEFRAKKAIAALADITALKSKVIRNGQVVEINTREVVPGDLLVLTTGVKVAADASIVHSISLETDESALTGESIAVEKAIGNELFAGTVIVTGEGLATVTATGPATRLGKIAAQTSQIKIPRTPLQLAMRSLSGKLVYVALFFSVAIPLAGFLRGQDWKVMVITGLALAFAVIPEELPIVITMVLGLGSYNLSKHNFLVKRLRTTEAMANTTVIVTDKTGTITENKMKIVSVYPDGQPDVLRYAAGCISEFDQSPLDREILNKLQEIDFVKLPEIVRERGLGNGHKTKCMLRGQGDDFQLYLSGAPEEVFSACSHVPEEAQQALAIQTHMGRRVIAIASRKFAAEEVQQLVSPAQNLLSDPVSPVSRLSILDSPNLKSIDLLTTHLDFIGLISFEDRPRQGVKETIARAAAAGIRTLMVTGDHPATANSIATQVGIDTTRELTGPEVDQLDDPGLADAVKTVSIFARTTPEHKYRIVSALQKNHEIVAVTGDGINDILALKGANIGIAMGLRGTDVAREAADAILADDNYSTLTQGIFEGRGLFDNLVKGIKYYLTIKLALISIFILPVILGLPMPFSPIQIIILELFMDLAASAGFVAEPKEKNIYLRPPRDPQKNIFDRAVLTDMVIKALFLFHCSERCFPVFLQEHREPCRISDFCFRRLDYRSCGNGFCLAFGQRKSVVGRHILQPRDEPLGIGCNCLRFAGDLHPRS